MNSASSQFQEAHDGPASMHRVQKPGRQRTGRIVAKDGLVQGCQAFQFIRWRLVIPGRNLD
jgi:hypothetical protein